MNLELRPPSVREMMRLWLHALVGGMLGDDPEQVSMVKCSDAICTVHGILSFTPLGKR